MGANEKVAAALHYGVTITSPDEAAARHRARVDARDASETHVMQDGACVAVIRAGVWHAPVCYVESCHGECYAGSGWSR